MQRRLLFVDDEEVIRVTLATILNQNGFDVATAATVPEALQKITREKFDVLLSDLNIGNPGDGLTVVSAMRRTQPNAVTMILTGYPAFETALEAIRQQVDEYILKPADVPALIRSLESKLAMPPRQRHLPPPKRVAMLLQEHMDRIEELWLSAVEQDATLSRIAMTKEKRLHRVRLLLQKVIRGAQAYSGPKPVHSPASAHGVTARNFEECPPIIALREFSLLRTVLSRIVQENLLAVNLSYLIPDLARVNECLDEQAQATLELLSERV